MSKAIIEGGTYHRLKNRTSAYGLLASASLCAALLAGCGSQPIPAPTAFAAYQGKDGSFAIEYPEGWSAEGGGSRNLYWAKFNQQTAQIRVNTDLVGSLLGSLAQSANQMAGTSNVPELTPVAQVHPLKLDQMKEQYAAYEEEIGRLVATGLGDAWTAEFTTKDSFGRLLHGYRATALSRDLRITMICVCREDDWPTLQPAFDTVVESLSAGQP